MGNSIKFAQAPEDKCQFYRVHAKAYTKYKNVYTKSFAKYFADVIRLACENKIKGNGRLKLRFNLNWNICLNQAYFLMKLKVCWNWLKYGASQQAIQFSHWIVLLFDVTVRLKYVTRHFPSDESPTFISPCTVSWVETLF